MFEEEMKSAKLFLWVFNFAYIIFQGPHIKGVNFNTGTYKFVLAIGLCLLMLVLLLIGIHCIKREIPHAVKYVYLIGYLFGDIFCNVTMYLSGASGLGAGNFMESVLTFFVPIFMSTRYLWVLTTSLVIKYSVIIAVFQEPKAFLTMLVPIVILGISYILLMRFQSYIEGINKVFTKTKQKQQLAVIGEMSAAIGHEIRNPLTSLKGFTQLQKEKYPDDPVYPNMIQEIERMNEMISELMILGKPRSMEYGIHSVKQLILAAITETEAEQKMLESKIKVNHVFTEDAPNIECDASQIQYVLVHAIKKVIETMKQEKNINVGMYMITENQALIYISDRMCTIDRKSRGDIANPFEMKKESEIALGLMAIYKIVNEHQGQVYFNHGIITGTKIEVILPITQAEQY
ncbi:histidine kinase dimerization/phospho-acceptor domain-containing protein [Bacillus sp. S13(2024)]|uniref:histidine kinase dimerization/phospho-acceptor domain-containing protein n=1 Tax=unclassified Bacillus (in: firmicutes) TaxID=185979 RepID=UPI003D1A59AB